MDLADEKVHKLTQARAVVSQYGQGSGLPRGAVQIVGSRLVVVELASHGLLLRGFSVRGWRWGAPPAMPTGRNVPWSRRSWSGGWPVPCSRARLAPRAARSARTTAAVGQQKDSSKDQGGVDGERCNPIRRRGVRRAGGPTCQSVLIDMLVELPSGEVLLPQRRYGAPWMMPTKVLFMGLFRHLWMSRLCTTRGQGHTCGRPSQ